MIAGLIRWSVANRFLVLLAALFIAAAGAWSVLTTPLDAIPDLSDRQRHHTNDSTRDRRRRSWRTRSRTR